MLKKSLTALMTIASLNSAAPAIAIGTFAVTAAAVAPAYAGKVENAVYKAVVESKQTKKVKVSGHEFNIKPVKVIRTAFGYTVNGQLSHHLGWRKDDQYYFTIHIDRNGTIIDLQEKINRGGLTSMVVKLPVGAFISAKTKGKVDKNTAKAVIKASGHWLGRQIDGKWEKSARKIVVMIGLQVAQHKRLSPNM
ncbi:MAG: hypothetical protein AAF626_00545 [Pseudomonadota bacterium]